MYNYILLLASVLIIATGQVIFKFAAINLREAGSIFNFISINAFSIMLVMIALCLYLISTVAWVHALRVIPLSVAYPFNALAFLIIPLVSTFLFNETLPRFFLVSLILVWTGILLLML